MHRLIVSIKMSMKNNNRMQMSTTKIGKQYKDGMKYEERRAHEKGNVFLGFVI